MCEGMNKRVKFRETESLESKPPFCCCAPDEGECAMPHEIFRAGANQMFSDSLSCAVITPPRRTICFNCVCTCRTNWRACRKANTAAAAADVSTRAGNYRLGRNARPHRVSVSGSLFTYFRPEGASKEVSRHRRPHPESSLPPCAKAAGEPSSWGYR